MFEIFKLVGSVLVDTDQADKSLQKTDENATSFASTLGSVGKTALGVGSAIVGAAATVGTATIGMAKDAAATADTIDKASIRMGVSKEYYQELAYAAGQCGVEMSTMEMAGKKLEGSGLDLSDAMNEIMSFGTESERSAKAAELFGDKVAYQLSPLIEQSTESYDDLIQRSHDLGLIMSDEAVTSGVQFGDLLSDLTQSIGMLSTNLGASLFPILNQLIEYAIGYMPQVQALVDEFAPVVSGMLDALLPMLFQVSEEILPVLFDTLNQLLPMASQIVASVLPVLIELIIELLPLALQIIESVLPLAVTLLDSLMPLITAIIPLLPPIVELLVAIIEPLVEILTEILPPIIDIIVNLIEGIIPLLVETIEWLSKMVKKILSETFDNLKPIFEGITKMFKGLTEFLLGIFTNDWKRALNGILDIAKGIINLLIGYVEVSVNSILSGINVLVSGAADILNNIPGVNIEAFEIPKLNIPKLAKGGTISQSGTVLVGENGPELLSLGQGARVNPLQNNAIGISKDELKEVLVDVLSSYGISLELRANNDAIFNGIVKQNNEFKRMHGGVSAI